MKSHVIQAVILTGLKNFLPRFNVGRWITRERKIAAEMGAAKIDRMAVEDELIGVGVEIAQGEDIRDVFVKIEFAGSAADSDSQAVERRRELVPEFCIFAQIEFWLLIEVGEGVLEVLAASHNFHWRSPWAGLNEVFDLSFGLFAGKIMNNHLCPNAFICCIGENPDVVNPHERRGAQFDLSDDSVPSIIQ